VIQQKIKRPARNVSGFIVRSEDLIPDIPRIRTAMDPVTLLDLIRGRTIRSECDLLRIPLQTETMKSINKTSAHRGFIMF
jgi:hypothetical protein